MNVALRASPAVTWLTVYRWLSVLRGWCFLALLVILRSYVFWDFFVISEKFRLRILMKLWAFYIIRFEEFENHSDTPRKNREHYWIEVIFVHHETFFEKKWKFWKKLKILKVRFDCDSALKILLETGLDLKFHANLKKIWKTSWCINEIFLVKNENFEKN